MHKRKAVAEFEEPVAYSKAERPSTKAVRPSNDEEEGVQPGEQQLPLTESVQLNLNQLRASQEDLVAKIDDLTRTGLAFLEGLRDAFAAKMATVKAELGQVVDTTEGALRSRSLETLALQQRAQMATNLAGLLNVKARAQDAQDLFSAEQGSESEEGADHAPATAP